MRSGNPALGANSFIGLERQAETMTIQGTVNKTFVLLLLVILSAAWIWQQPNVTPWMIGGVVGGFVLAIVTVFKKRWAVVTAPVYALLEGLFLGGMSAILEARFPGIVMQAVGLTFGTLLSLLAAYSSRLIRPSENFKLGIVAATGGIMLVYVASLLLGFFGISIPLIHSNGWVGIGFSLFVVVIAALNLVLDFDFIEQGAAQGSPKYMEWYGAFGLIITLVWLYIEILRLLSKLYSRD